MTALDDFQRGSSLSAAKAQANQGARDALVHVARNRTLVSAIFAGDARRLSLAKVATSSDAIAAEALLGPALIMRSTSQPEVLRGVAPAEGMRLDVVELEEGTRFAAVAVRRHVGALKPVASDDLAAGTETRDQQGDRRVRCPPRESAAACK